VGFGLPKSQFARHHAFSRFKTKGPEGEATRGTFMLVFFVQFATSSVMAFVVDMYDGSPGRLAYAWLAIAGVFAARRCRAILRSFSGNSPDPGGTL
jgi:hypothetical protein